jgi:hypothetical protein
MNDPAVALTLQLLEWIAERPRRYEDVIATWRTTCPRLSIWEDACSDGLIDGERGSNLLRLSAKGQRVLDTVPDRRAL